MGPPRFSKFKMVTVGTKWEANYINGFCSLRFLPIFDLQVVVKAWEKKQPNAWRGGMNENVTHGIICLNACPQSIELFGKDDFWERYDLNEEVCHWGPALRFQMPITFPVSLSVCLSPSLPHSIVPVDQDVNS